MEDVQAGRLRMTVGLSGYVSVDKTVIVVPPLRADRPVELEPVDLEGGGSVEGQVVDARGDPVRGARVARDTVANVVPVAGLRAADVTGKGGEFRLGDLPEGPVTIEAYAPEAGRGRVTVDVRAGRTTDRVKITLGNDPQALADDAAAGGVAITLGAARAGAQGLEVRAVARGSEAERAGVERGDHLVSVDGQPVRTVADAMLRLNGPLADDVVVELERGGDRQKLRVARERVHR